jgi:hypothetical protein
MVSSWSVSGSHSCSRSDLLFSTAFSVARYYMFICWVFLAFLSLTYFGNERERIGDMVAWGAYTQSISGVAHELVSTSEFAHRYRVTVSEIAEKLSRHLMFL